MNRPFTAGIDDELVPDPNEEYLLYQTLVGTWPADPVVRGSARDVLRPHRAIHAKGLARGQDPHLVDESVRSLTKRP